MNGSLDRLNLYHYFESENGPFKNLSALPMEEARRIMKSLREKNVFASQRSDDYLVIRKALEEKARKLFIQKGGKPKSNFPYYMTLGRCEWLKEWYKKGEEIKMDIHEFDSRTLSFTYGDLFPAMRYKDGKPYRETVYTLDEIMSVIGQYGWPQEWNRLGDKGPERYIEVQVWDDKIIKKLLNKEKFEKDKYDQRI